MSTPYTVKGGDTLSLIAKKFYGDDHLYQRLASFNHLNNPNNLRPGQVLQIPTRSQLLLYGAPTTPVRIDKNLPWGKLVIDLTKGRVHLTQQWQWTWLQMPAAQPGTAQGPAWGQQEKIQFKTSVISQINQKWNGGKVRFRVSGNSDFSKKFGGSPLPMVFLVIDGTVADKHWDVSAYKDADTHDRSFVDLAGRKITFYKANLPLHDVCLEKVNPGDAEVCTTNHTFSTPAHEFGHTLQNLDEYTAAATDRSDKESIENIGTHIRARHLTAILNELNTMIPDCQFAVG